MKNTTYLFGAGASCNCLPIYSNFNERFVEFENFFQPTHSPFGPIILPNSSTDELTKTLKFYIEELRFHSTPDTYAKKLFHTKEKKELDKFKNILILFFLYEQLQGPALFNVSDKQAFDKR